MARPENEPHHMPKMEVAMIENASLNLTSDDVFLMGKGEWFRSYDKMGAHPCTCDGVDGWHFSVWAPDVVSVHVVGDFNGWDEWANPLTCTETGGVWEGFIPGLGEGELYKYVIETAAGERLYKADPYAFSAQCPPETASRTCDISGYAWGDSAWMRHRDTHPHMKQPLNIYEVHLGSWKRHDDGLSGNGGQPAGDQDAGGSYLTYDELSEQLVEYVKRMGYTHIELMPVMEYPFDGSWGYQVTGYYAPTSRYGTPKQFMHFVDACHRAGIGVIADWVPGGCCADAHGLARFNGTALYEGRVHPTWGTLKFALGKGEVQTFLISNALYWLEAYHIDGLRVDGVSSMLYLNFGVDDPGQKIFNENGGEQDWEAVYFLQQFNKAVAQYFPSAMTIAEESTAWPLVTYPPDDGGLGFHYKWDMGWMNDTLHYMQTDFPWRPGNHGMLTFSIMYAFNENFVLPLSHDEVVHGKCSLIGRMPGDYWRQFAGLRSLAFYQMTHPGAKLNFMGNEVGQFIEWRYYEGVELFLAERYDAHRNHQAFIAALNDFYRNSPALWQNAYVWEGYDWIDANDADQSIISFVRHGDNEKDDLVVLINFDPRNFEEFRVGVPVAGTYREVFNSDAVEYGGSGVINTGDAKSEDVPWNGREQSIVIRVPPLAGIALRCVRRAPKKRAKAKVEKKTANSDSPKETKASTKPTKAKRAPKAGKPKDK